ncbi:MAG: hypothetical protein AABY07_01170 [Nanoarchaeota archaeon]
MVLKTREKLGYIYFTYLDKVIKELNEIQNIYSSHYDNLELEYENLYGDDVICVYGWKNLEK